eukprot:scaffold141687_cov34-Attheya_sp.AAC.1
MAIARNTHTYSGILFDSPLMEASEFWSLAFSAGVAGIWAVLITSFSFGSFIAECAQVAGDAATFEESIVDK